MSVVYSSSRLPLVVLVLVTVVGIYGTGHNAGAQSSQPTPEKPRIFTIQDDKEKVEVICKVVRGDTLGSMLGFAAGSFPPHGVFALGFVRPLSKDTIYVEGRLEVDMGSAGQRAHSSFSAGWAGPKYGDPFLVRLTDLRLGHEEDKPTRVRIEFERVSRK